MDIFYCRISTLFISHKHSCHRQPSAWLGSRLLLHYNHSAMSTKASCQSSSTGCHSLFEPLKCVKFENLEELVGRPFSADKITAELLQELVSDALIWCTLHGLAVADRNNPRSGKVPGVGVVHAPFSLLPSSFSQNHWRHACNLAPIFNELVDRVSLDGEFLQDSLSRAKKVDAFTGRLLDIHCNMLKINKKEEIRLGLHRSDYMLDAQSNRLLQIELNTISASFPGLSCLVSELHRCLLNNHGSLLGFDSKRILGNTAASRFAEALAKAWNEFNNSSAVIMVVVQPNEHNMYDQHWLCSELRERHNVTTIRRTLADIDREGLLQPDGTLQVGKWAVAVIYFRAGYSPVDYPSKAEWRARLLMEQSSAIKCPSISYHLVGTKMIQQKLAQEDVLERFVDKDDVSKLRKCFAGLWSLDDATMVQEAIESPEHFVLKPQREGGGNNLYGDELREALIKLKAEGGEGLAAYVLMQRIYPLPFIAIMVRDGAVYEDHAISELGIYGAYLRSKEKVILNDSCGYLVRTKVASSNEGGVAAGFAVLDSLYLT